MKDIEIFRKNGLTAIIRNYSLDDFRFILECLLCSKIKNVEITLNTKQYEDMFRIINDEYPGEFFVGAGTVLSIEDVAKAKEMGSKYIILPNMNPQIIKKTKELNLISIPGAFTPSEIVTAYNLGADIVKLFPAISPEYARAIKQPLNNIPIIAVGVPLEQVSQYKEAGIDGFGAGGNFLFPNEYVKTRNKEKLVSHIINYRNEVCGYENS